MRVHVGSQEAVRIWLAAASMILIPFSVNIRSYAGKIFLPVAAFSTVAVSPFLLKPVVSVLWLALFIAGMLLVAVRRRWGHSSGAAPAPVTNGAIFSWNDLLIPIVLFMLGGLVAGTLYGGRAWSLLRAQIDSNQHWIIALGLLIAVVLSDDFVVALLDLIAQRVGGISSLIPTAATNPYIGWLERLLIYIFILGGHPEAAALAFTAKSLARLPQMSRPKHQDAFAEYFLMGTLASMSAAMGIAAIVRISLGWSAL